MPDKLTDNEKTYKITFHFDGSDDFLEGFFVIVRATDSISALQNVLDYGKYITIWKGKTICVNFEKFAYTECEEVNADAR